ncbi:MAG: hypothetical protein CVU43_12600 [Chloroflexi bacterium HGW-Chloroflexi-5]|jgi:chromosomal replication initiation ATPase DnaA|nr:MAG: hypothetical protein CVU43_12600 [Chloroflexi bacterium HGW-Chloroflexi-5]PKP09848.1 MAG: hypothetical protein CVU09_09470 [Bacteroidetes bacterium HGW-Bacteroidetes-4]
MPAIALKSRVGAYAIPGIIKDNSVMGIKLKVAELTGVGELIDVKLRDRHIVEARQIAMYISKQCTKASLAKIGLTCGGKDHATVLHACKTVSNLLETDVEYRKKYREVFEYYDLGVPVKRLRKFIDE